MINEILEGAFIKAKYKYGQISGIVTKVKKDVVVIKVCSQWYKDYTLTERVQNVTKSRVHQVGLGEDESVLISTKTIEYKVTPSEEIVYIF